MNGLNNLFTHFTVFFDEGQRYLLSTTYFCKIINQVPHGGN